MYFIHSRYSYLQYRLSFVFLSFYFVYFFSKKIFFEPSVDQIIYANPIGIRFASACGFLLLWQIFTSFMPIYSLFFLLLTYLYLLQPSLYFEGVWSGLADLETFLFSLYISYFIFLALCIELSRKYANSKIFFLRPYIYYPSLFLFFISLASHFFIGMYFKFIYLQFIFFLLVWDLKVFSFWVKKGNSNSRPILFFDGLCGFCNFWVDIVLNLDFRHQFFFSPLQGKLASKILSQKQREEQQSLVLYTENKTYEGARAILLVTRILGGLFFLLYLIFNLVPISLLDKIYSWIAKRRYQFSQKLEKCRIPSQEEKKYFLE